MLTGLGLFGPSLRGIGRVQDVDLGPGSSCFSALNKDKIEADLGVVV